MKKQLGRLVLILIASFMIIPFLYMFMTSLRVTYTAYNFKFALDDLTLKNYREIFYNTSFIIYFLNSLFISLSGVLLTVVFSSMAGYAFAKLEFRGREKIFFFMLMTLIIPSQVTLLPLYVIMRQLGWLNTYMALILPLPTAVGVFIMRQSILKVPRDLMDAARIDGCSEFRIFIEVVLPLIKPAIIALSIFTFIGAWNEFLWPLIATTSNSMRTLTVGMASMNAQYSVNYGLVMAGATMTFLPSFIFYILLQKQFEEGVALSGLKG
ncbi:MAG: carbohydrate ABC transporter permease [Psychrilyobacter sp.]|uniref:carbohydrate ABC transporter permease n=1 Tax=Psychrilyobacter sp. TaxID=2586924 RepID=UPI003C785A69